jgi:dTDP-4-amino-4,6-dideoxygalactose transaminase
MTSAAVQRPAVLGGTPIRPQGPPEWPKNDESVRAVIEQMSRSGDWGRYHGPHGPELSRRLAEFHNVEHALLCSSGTAAVELALRGVGVGQDNEVILAGYDFKANFQNILCLGAVPVLVDLLPTTWQIDPTRIVSAISPRTKAILISHLHGGVVDAPEIRKIADAHGIAVVEDACQNPGALINGRRAGTWGDVGVLSFGGSKLLTAGRGGAILTHRTDIAERIKRHVLRGNDAYPLSEFQCAILVPQLKQLNELNDRRGKAVHHLKTQLHEFPGFALLQAPDEKVHPAYYKVGIRYHSDEFAGLSRDQFTEAMRAEGIAIDAGFRSLHLTHASRRFRAADDLRESTLADADMLTLHHPILLEDETGIAEIVTAIRKVRESSTEIVNAICNNK